MQLVEEWVKANNCTIFDICPSVIGTDERISGGEFSQACIDEFIWHYKQQGKEAGRIAMTIVGYACGPWGRRLDSEVDHSRTPKREPDPEPVSKI